MWPLRHRSLEARAMVHGYGRPVSHLSAFDMQGSSRVGALKAICRQFIAW
jgi:hypothetical protein